MKTEQADRRPKHNLSTLQPFYHEKVNILLRTTIFIKNISSFVFVRQIFFISTLLLVALISNAQHEEYVYEKRNFLKRESFVEPTNSNYDLIYHRINWAVDPDVEYIEGSVFSKYKILNSSANYILFNLSSDLTVDSIKQRGVRISFSHSNDIINIPVTTNEGDVDSVTIFYKGKPGYSGFGSFITSKHDGVPILWTLSEPYGAKDWWPCKQTLHDKIDSIDIAITVPSGNKAASNGILYKTEETSGKTIYHWKHRYPIATYLVAIAVTNYKEVTNYAKVTDTDSVPVLNYLYPEDFEYYLERVKYTTYLIELYSDKFIPYPYAKEKYGHAQFGWSGGMEHQTMSFMGSFSEAIIAHELAHQWFGNHVTCGSWQDLWINEGFAIWSEGVAIKNLHPERYHDWISSRIMSTVANTKSGSVFIKDTIDIDRLFDSDLTYIKAGMVLHQLEHQIGEDVFSYAIKAMLNSGKHFVRTEDLVQFFNHDLYHFYNYDGTIELPDNTEYITEYFNNWIYGEGYPKYTIDVEEIYNDRVDFRILQTTTHPSNDFFKMNVPIRFEGDNDTITFSFSHQTNNQKFSAPLSFKANTISFDPEYTIIAPHPAIIRYPEDKKLIEERVILMPNPSSDNVEITWIPTISVQKIEAYNTVGKRVYSKDIKSNKENSITIDVSKFSSGEYIFNIYAYDKAYSMKFLKE